MNSLRLALGCLTLLPIGPRATPDGRAFGRSWMWFPLVGLLIGSLLAAARHAVTPSMPPLVTTAVLLILWVVITGALHLDGLADIADGLYAGRSSAERLRIMKDPHIGTMAVLAVTLQLLFKLALIHSLSSSAVTPALLLAPCLGRYAMVILGTTLPYARTEGGTAASFVRHASLLSLLIALIAALAASWLLAGRGGLGLLGAAIGVSWILRAVFLRTLGGVTGDALGAVGEIVESTMLVCAVAWL